MIPGAQWKLSGIKWIGQRGNLAVKGLRLIAILLTYSQTPFRPYLRREIPLKRIWSSSLTALIAASSLAERLHEPVKLGSAVSN
jgi:hypothetical protein